MRWLGLRRETVAFYLFLAPWFMGLVLWTLGPMVASFYFGFTAYDVVTPPRWLGLGNYAEIFGSEIFWQSLKVTVLYTIGAVSLGVLGALVLASLLNQKLPGLSVWRTIFYLPVVTAGVAVALLWAWLLNPNYGLVNALLFQLFGLQGPGWFFDETWVIPSFVLVQVWAVGGPMLIYLAAMQGVPTHLYEAAEIDGADALRRYWHVTLPMITPAIFFNVVLSTIGSFQVFTAAYVITRGGPNFASYFYVLYLYQNAFEYFRMGYASALAWILFLIILAVTALAFRSQGLWVYYESPGRGGP